MQRQFTKLTSPPQLENIQQPVSNSPSNKFRRTAKREAEETNATS